MPWTAYRRLALVSIAAVASLAWTPPAAAHGPCRCTWPAVAAPGSVVRTTSGYKAIWNPAAADFADQTTPIDLAGGHRADAPTHTVVQGSPRHPRRRMVIRIPRATPPGIYILLVFDGSEGGHHSTWDYVQVAGQDEAPAPGHRTATTGADGPASRAITIAAFALGMVVGALVVSVRSTRRRRRWSRHSRRPRA
jgi:hypothetical protein